jgi:hypothetical protein
MTSEQIDRLPILGMDPEEFVGANSGVFEAATQVQKNMLLKEIAYQLAVMNEKRSERHGENFGGGALAPHAGAP